MGSNNIFLTGFMGVGKSVVGALLAEKMHWSFIDTDQQIEILTGKKIKDLFIEGEEQFREIECNVISDVVQKDRHVVALGGGALLPQRSRLKILGAGFLVYLNATPSTLLSRLETSHDERPLLEGKKGEERLLVIKKLLGVRENIYQGAHLTVETDKKTPTDIAHEIFFKYGSRV